MFLFSLLFINDILSLNSTVASSANTPRLFATPDMKLILFPMFNSVFAPSLTKIPVELLTLRFIIFPLATVLPVPSAYIPI